MKGGEIVRGRDLFLAGFGLAALFLQLPVTKMILDDPQSLHLGIWNNQAFVVFSFLTFAVIPLCLGLVLAVWGRSYPKSCAVVLAMGISFIVAAQINFHYLQFHFPHAAWRPLLSVSLFLLPIMPLIRFREPVVRVLKTSSLFGLAIFAFFAAHAAPQRLAMASTPAPSAPPQGGPPVFVLTFEKLVSSYLTDEQGRLLKDRFPNVARFAQEADYYPEAYANSTATVYALKTLYSGRYWTKERNWWTYPTLTSILGADRRTYMLLDVLTEYCRPPAVGMRTVGVDRLTSSQLVTAWYRTYLNTILPAPLEARLVRALGLRRTFNTAWDIWERESGDYVSVGRRQFERLTQLVQAEGQAPNLYIMHNFISDGPEVTMSVLLGDRPTESTRAQELEATRAYLLPFDAALGRFLDQLRASGLYDRSLILIAADTGYDPGYRWVPGHTELVASQDLTRIFLAIKRPGQRAGRIISAPIQQVDVLPTLLTHLGIDPAPFHFEGVPVTGREPPTNFARHPVRFSIASLRGGLLLYDLVSPHGPLRPTEHRGGSWHK